MKLFLFIVGLVTITHAHYIPSSKTEERIINGDNVELGEIPFQVSLQQIESSAHFCGGSIISTKTVLTAAHCVYRQKARRIKVVAGTVSLDNPTLTYRVQDIIVHESFNDKTTQHDIALLVIVGEFAVTSSLNYVQLENTNNQIPGGTRAIVSGWGVTKQGGSSSTHLQKAEIFIVGQDYCKKQYKNIKLPILSSHICALNPFSQKGACNGDSGGPLIIDGKQVGIVSWSYGCALQTYPTVYTDTRAYVDWIDQYKI